MIVYDARLDSPERGTYDEEHRNLTVYGVSGMITQMKDGDAITVTAREERPGL